MFPAGLANTLPAHDHRSVGHAAPRQPETFRPATLDDAAFGADAAIASRPDEPEDAAAWRHWWATEDPAWTNERFIVLRDGMAIGFARHNHARWDQVKKRYGGLGFELLPAERADAQLGTVFDVIEARPVMRYARLRKLRARGGRMARAVVRRPRIPSGAAKQRLGARPRRAA